MKSALLQNNYIDVVNTVLSYSCLETILECGQEPELQRPERFGGFQFCAATTTENLEETCFRRSFEDDDPSSQGNGCGFGPVLYFQLLEDMADMELHGYFGNIEGAGNFSVAQPLHHQA